MFRELTKPFLSVLDDMNTLMMSHHSFLLGNWVRSAERLALNILDKYLFRFNSLNQVTLWGPNGEVSDYAGKQWADLIESYYKARWSLFFKYNEISMSQGVRFNQSIFLADLYKYVEEPFSWTQQQFVTEPRGDSFSLARQLHTKYRDYL
ncbi:hypothetical protein EB796_014983 [Bugula neritina]|uniref:Alpha-N-acetylglucosaminidase C-terminal domain-containing protein n=1 Tax=Bugula neritina TaxID=10212 RepID=A0A7J7JM24_BUGNE|nr:hypothetical protein EB796_014983 [Bugula neritina]